MSSPNVTVRYRTKRSLGTRRKLFDMGKVVAFSETVSYFERLDESNFVRGTVLDTNILISLTYEIKSDYEEVVEFVDKLLDENFKLFTTVNTKSEFLDFHRRLFITEHLRDMVAPDSTWKISKAARAQIQSQSGQLRRNEKARRRSCF